VLRFCIINTGFVADSIILQSYKSITKVNNILELSNKENITKNFNILSDAEAQ